MGHRSLMRYYKQRFGLSRTVAVAKNQKAVGRILQQYRALGWTGSTGVLIGPWTGPGTHPENGPGCSASHLCCPHGSSLEET